MGGVGPRLVVEGDPAPDAGSGLRSGFSGVQVDAFILQGPPEALDEDVVQAAAFCRLRPHRCRVNNAGSGLFGALEDKTLDETRHLFDVDDLAPISIIRTALPYLRAQVSGHIVNITSIAGRAPGTGASVYASAKAALEGLSAALANEVQPLGIRVTAVAPGQFRTGFMSDTSVHKAAGSARGLLHHLLGHHLVAPGSIMWGCRWYRLPGSNGGPPDPQSGALTN